MKRKLVALFMTAAMVSSFSLTTFAADGDAATAPKDTEVTGSDVASTGAASMSSADGTTFNVTGDDDNKASAVDTEGADINVWAKVVDKGTKVYKVDLAWGAMKFEFNSGSGQWDTTEHVYKNSNQGGTASWTASYLDGTNNKVTVTNHSNSAVDATFAYAMDLSEGKSMFNDAPTGDNAVIGNFFENNGYAATAAGVLTGTHTTNTVNDAAVTNKLTDSKISLATADAYTDAQSAQQVAGARTDEVYFAFSGTPDEGKGATLDSFKKVGVITVTVAPNTDAALN